MLELDHPETGGDRISCVAHSDIITALDTLAASRGENRSHTARRVIALALQEAGLLPIGSPMTPRAGQRRTRTKKTK